MSLQTINGTFTSIVKDVFIYEYEFTNNDVTPESCKPEKFLKNWKFNLVDKRKELITDDDSDITYFDYKEFVINQASIGNLEIDDIIVNFKNKFNVRSSSVG